MSAGSQGVHTIRATLVKGHHDALLDIYRQHSRRLANMMILRISEACQDGWPLSMNDYTPLPSPLTDAMVVKITVRRDLCPKLFQRYEVLPRIGRSIVFVNMLNRHVDLSIGAPHEVEKAMLALDVPRLASVSQQDAPVQPAAEEIASPLSSEHGPARDAEVEMIHGQVLANQGRSAQPETSTMVVEPLPAEPVLPAIEVPDPLDDFNCGL